MTATEILGYVPKFYQNEAVEIRFHSIRAKDKYQLAISVSQAGIVNYSLHRVPNGALTESMTNLSGRENAKCHLPMKAYENWQADVIEWLSSLGNANGSFYEIDEVL
jgi:hypothetical protein